MQDDEKKSIKEELNQGVLPSETAAPEGGPRSADSELEQKETQIEKKPEFEKDIAKQVERPGSAVQQISDDDGIEAEKQADKLRDIQQEGGKIDQLISLAKEKGVDFAINVARKTNDPTLLDLLHDKIIEKGLQNEL